MSAPVIITLYDPLWVTQYNEEAARIQLEIGEWLAGLEHVGSTAVPGLAAKPVIDILAGLRTLADAPHCIPRLQGLGYRYIPDYELDLPERRYFQKLIDGQHSHHIHMVEVTSDFWRRHLLFRDYLRSHPDDARAYGELKLRLAEQFENDRAAYTDAKGTFINEVMAKAEVWAKQKRAE